MREISATLNSSKYCFVINASCFNWYCMSVPTNNIWSIWSEICKYNNIDVMFLEQKYNFCRLKIKCLFGTSNLSLIGSSLLLLEPREASWLWQFQGTLNKYIIKILIYANFYWIYLVEYIVIQLLVLFCTLILYCYYFHYSVSSQFCALFHKDVSRIRSRFPAVQTHIYTFKLHQIKGRGFDRVNKFKYCCSCTVVIPLFTGAAPCHCAFVSYLFHLLSTFRAFGRLCFVQIFFFFFFLRNFIYICDCYN